VIVAQAAQVVTSARHGCLGGRGVQKTWRWNACSLFLKSCTMKSSVLMNAALVILSVVSQAEAASQPLDDDLLGAELSEPWLSQRLTDYVPFHPRHHHRHHHHGHHHHAFRGSPRFGSHRTALAMAAPTETMTTPSENVPHLSADDVASQVEDPQAGMQQTNLLPGRHPSVERVLSSMDNEMQELDARKKAAGDARERLQDMMSDAALHVNDPLDKMNDIAKEQVTINATQQKLQSLEDNEHRLEGTHDRLIAILHSNMDPKIRRAEEHLEKEQGMERKIQEEVEIWHKKDESYKASALQLLEDRKVAQEGLVQAEEAMAAVQRQVEMAQKGLQMTTRQAEEEVEKYRYVKSKYIAAASKEKLGEEQIDQAEHSVQKLRSIFDIEQHRIDQALAVGKDKLHGKIRKLESASEKDGQELQALRQEYADWQHTQRGRAQQVTQAQAMTDQLADAFEKQQDQVLDAANDKVAEQAMDNSDWAWGDNSDWD